MFTYQSNPGVYGKNAAKWPYGRLSNPEGQDPLNEGATWERHGDGNEPVQPVKNHLPWGKAFYTSHTGHGSPADRADASPHHRPPRAGPGFPRPGFRPRGIRGPEPPAGPARSLLSRRTAAAPRHRAPGARLPSPGPGRMKVTSTEVKRPAANTEGTHKVLVPTCHPATAVQPQPSGRLILLREDGAGRRSSRSAKRAVTSGLLPCAILFGSVAGSALMSSAIFVKG